MMEILWCEVFIWIYDQDDKFLYLWDQDVKVNLSIDNIKCQVKFGGIPDDLCRAISNDGVYQKIYIRPY